MMSSLSLGLDMPMQAIPILLYERANLLPFGWRQFIQGQKQFRDVVFADNVELWMAWRLGHVLRFP